MHHHSSAGLSPYARWLPLLASVVCTAITSASAQGTPTPAVPKPLPPPVADSGSHAVAIPGIPTLPDIVTVVPFHAYQSPNGDAPWVMIPAELDGHRGTFSLDTGAPVFLVNTSYLRSKPTGGFDTVTTGEKQGFSFVPVHTLRVGTLLQHYDGTPTGLPPGAPYPTNAVAQDFSANGILGNVGLSGLEPFETIVDYVHQRVIFIRLDKDGRRLATVPAYVPAGTIQLLPVVQPSVGGTAPQWWGIRGRNGSATDTILVDTGAPTSDIAEGDQQQLADHLKQVIAARQTSANISDSVVTVAAEQGKSKTLGAQFLTRVGVVGFNLRLHQMILYR